VFTARYGLSPYISQISFFFKGLKLLQNTGRLTVAKADFSFERQSFQLQMILLADRPV